RVAFKQALNILTLAVILLHPGALSGQVKLPRLISDGAVLQRDDSLKLWGWAGANERVRLDFKQERYETQASPSGEWAIVLPPQPAGGPYSLRFTASNEVTVEDVWFGDVWLCSGQSNMELTMERVKEKYSSLVAAPGSPMIRQFLVPDKYDFKREYDGLDDGAWVAAAPETILGFTAVGYFFAREIYEQTGAPVGLINAALGGSPVESWMSESALRDFPEAYAELQRFKDDKLIDSIEAADKARIGAWYDSLNAKDQGLSNGSPAWAAPGLDDSSWPQMDIPGFWAQQAIGDTNGVVWFRRVVEVPARMAGQPALLWMGTIVDQDFAYVNGKQVGTTGYKYPPRRYYFDGAVLKEGQNTIALRVVNSLGQGGFITDKPYFLAAAGDTLDLQGAWKYKAGAFMPPLQPQTFIRWKPGGLYNRMIHPLRNFRIKGVIWYQGESNTERPEGYSRAFSTMIEDWRRRWGQGDFPFLYVQLANFMEARSQPTESQWAALRQEQLETLAIPNTGMAVTADLGAWNDIHPMDKQSVGRRLALLARKMAYGEAELAAESPKPVSYKFGRKKVCIRFDHAGSGLVAKGGSPIQGMALSADGLLFRWAKCRARGNKVVVWHPEIKHPAALRYAWADNPDTANLYAPSGLPATPFEIRK
ncbi:MAG: sialate O-acetylesterase, partial [Phaeodactylibacter sp.]|nr:sialate O-acetylesterase [Phaeodactylibacter sp.]